MIISDHDLSHNVSLQGLLETPPTRHLEPDRQQAIADFARISYEYCQRHLRPTTFPWKEGDAEHGFGYLLEYWALLVLQDALAQTPDPRLQIVEAPLGYDFTEVEKSHRGCDYLLFTNGPTPRLLCGIDVTSIASTNEKGSLLFDPQRKKHPLSKEHGFSYLDAANPLPVAIVSLHELTFPFWQLSAHQPSLGLYSYMWRVVGPWVHEYGLNVDFPYCRLLMPDQKDAARNGALRALNHYLQEAYMILKRYSAATQKAAQPLQKAFQLTTINNGY